jgi:hypothetical protein
LPGGNANRLARPAVAGRYQWPATTQLTINAVRMNSLHELEILQRRQVE